MQLAAEEANPEFAAISSNTWPPAGLSTDTIAETMQFNRQEREDSRRGNEKVRTIIPTQLRASGPGLLRAMFVPV